LVLDANARGGAGLSLNERAVLGHRARDDQCELPTIILNLGLERRDPASRALSAARSLSSILNVESR